MNKKLILLVTLVCLLPLFSSGLLGCSQQAQTSIPPTNSGYHVELVYLGGDRILYFNSGGEYSIWIYDRNVRGKSDPLVNKEVWGRWDSINAKYHQLIYLGNDRVLDWKWADGDYRIWVYDRNAKGNSDPFSDDPEVSGNWETIKAKTGGEDSRHDVSLVYLGNDRVLEWHDDHGDYKIWKYNRDDRGHSDPFEGPESWGRWTSITDDGNHQLFYFGDQLQTINYPFPSSITVYYVLDLDQHGNYRVFFYDPNARGNCDALPVLQTKGKWISIISYGTLSDNEYKLIYLENDRLLVWRPYNGKFRIYVIDRNATGNEDPIPGSPEVHDTWEAFRWEASW